MEKGSKLIIIALALFLLISIVFAIQVNSSKQGMVNKYRKMETVLSEKNSSLESQLDKVDQERRRIEGRLGSIQDEINKIASDRDEWKKRYENVKKEKDDLIEQIKAKPAIVEKAAPVKPQLGDQEYWAGVLENKASLEIRLGELDKTLKDSLFQLEGIKKEKADLELEVSSLRQIGDDIERQLQYNQQLVASLSRELVREKSDRAAVIDQIEKIRQENLVLRRQVKELSSAKFSLEKGLNRLEGEKDDLAERITATEDILQNRMKELLDIRKDLEVTLGVEPTQQGAAKVESVELPPIVVRAGTQPTDAVTSISAVQKKDSRGKVLSINEANNFVIIDIGENDGVRIGDVFRIYRGNNHVASVEVIQTRKDISAADIKYQKQNIVAGDTASTP